MTRVMAVCSGLVLAFAVVVASPAAAQTPDKEKKVATTGAAKSMTAIGTVASVSADSITVKGKTAEWTFAVDDKTQVSATGASHKTAAMKGEKKPTLITDFVSVGDTVAVKYQDAGEAKHAASVRVTAKGSAKR